MSFLWQRRTLKRIQPPPNKFSDPNQEYNGTFDDDYVHKNNLTLNYTGKGLNFVFKGKGTVDLLGTTLNKPLPKTSSSVKFVTQVADSAVETKFDNKGGLRIWSDLGTYDFGFPLTASGKLKTNSGFDRLSYAAQLHARHGDVFTWNRLHVKASGNSFWNAKLLYERGDISVGFVHKLSLSTFLFSKLNLFGAYRLGNYTLFTELNNQGSGVKSSLTGQTLTVAGLWTARKNNYALKVVYDLLDKVDPLRVSVGTVTKVNDRTVIRAKIDNKTTLALSSKYVHNSNLTIQLGSQVTLNEPKSFSTDKVWPLPVGLALNFSYL